MEKEDKRGIFFGIIGVLTLIVAIIGASLAYFSINAKSKDDVLTVQAATVKIIYEDGNQLNVDKIIPSSKDVALRTFTRSNPTVDTEGKYKTCVDDNNYNVCGYYDFTLTNDGPNPMDITAKVVPTALVKEVKDDGGNVTTPGEIPFKNLKFILFDRGNTDDQFENGTEIYSGTVPYNEVAGDYSTFGLFGASGDETINISGNKTTKKLRLFVWLNDTENADNDAEQGAIFKGTVNIEVKGAGTIKGEAAE